ncbi:hypothetical protein [Aquipseudomonas alcaligenes]|uniref:hypothetical protein n=1 Tax=Aquipseudomonas alcaligenes TaxID=43263 RepID=UPI001658DD65|nr:hypothetical protein [Pseudomonas alcaligenes]
MKPLQEKIFLAVIICTITGCATEIDPKSLQPTPEDITISIDRPYTYTAQYGGMCKPRIKYSLAPGNYIAEFQDKNGIFYIGPKTPVSSELLTTECGGTIGAGLQIKGGVYLPNNHAQDAIIYFYQPPNALYDVFVLGETTHPPSGVIIETIIQSGYGKINFLPLQPKDGQLRKSLSQVR